ncbi:MAG: sugar phosphate isomerase/epimerase family protein [Deltaproteobacteria bacterium]
MNRLFSRRRLLQTAAAALPAAALFSSSRFSLGAVPFKLGIITDEITEKFEDALDFISSYSLEYCELRELWGKNIMNLSKDDLERARDLIEKHHLHVSDIGSPIMKYNLPEVPAREEKRDTFRANFTEQDTEQLFDQAFELARFFHTRKVRIFSYWRVADPEKAYPYVRDRLAKAAEIARKAGMLLVLENEHECNIGTGKELGRVLKEINSLHLQGNWDPGNAVMLAEVPYPDGYEAVRGWFAHMHAKDVAKDSATGKLKWAPVGGGVVDWKGQLHALRLDGYEGTMSLETHYRRPDGNKVESTRESLEGLLKLMREA